MIKPTNNTKVRIVIIFTVLIPIFLAISLWSEKSIDAHSRDFAAYWQAGHMILSGQDVYNSQEWVTERSLQGTAPHSEPTFQYPLPFAILMSPLGLLSVGVAFVLWMLIGEIAILISIFILFTFYPKRSMLFELLVIASAFLFRPTFYVIFSGQVLTEILLFITLSTYLFSKEKWLYGGLIASLTILKPSLGVPFLILIGIWLILKKRWAAITGIASGGLLLWGVGTLYNSHWVMDFLTIGRYSFDKYYGMQTTVWGVAGLILKASKWKVATGIVGVCVVLAITGYFVMDKKVKDNPFRIIATLIPAILLIAPYSWNYEQILLIIPIVYILIILSSSHGEMKATLFSLSMISFAIIMVLIANTQGHDVWSILVSGVIWTLMLFVPRFYPAIEAK
jgi:hypothetical protein